MRAPISPPSARCTGSWRLRGRPDHAATAIPTAVPTVVPTAVPTAIPTAVPTAYPIFTPYPTHTPYPTYTPYPTHIPSPSPSPTPVPSNNTQTNNQSQTVSTGSVNVNNTNNNTVTVNSPSSAPYDKKVLGTNTIKGSPTVTSQVEVKTDALPKTGIPFAFWGGSALLPFGLKLKRKLLSNSAESFSASTVWMKRQLDK